MKQTCTISEFIENGISANVSGDRSKDWSIRIYGNARLSDEGKKRWSRVLRHKMEIDGENAVVQGIMTDEDEELVCSLFNTLAGQVNEDVYGKYVVQAGDEWKEDFMNNHHKEASQMSKLKTANIGKFIEALEGIVNENSDAKEEKSQEHVIELLRKALADEWLASYQYWVCKNLARGNGRADATAEFDQHSGEEKDHADQLMLRINELGGKPIFDPAEWAAIGNPWTVVDTEDVCRELDITIQAEQDAIDYYQSIIDYCKGFDEITMRLCRSIMADEAEHLYDLQLLKGEFCK